MKYYIILFLFAIVGIASAQQTKSTQVEKDTTLTWKSANTVKLPFGKLDKDRVVGAVDVIEGKDLMHSSDYNVESVLAGQAPGLIVTKGPGDPGLDNTWLKIRGQSRGGSEDSPLIVIDGIANRSLSSITLEEIESIEVLKDITAKMLYGSKAANGVIQVTTKRGYDGKKKVTFSGEYGIKTPSVLPEYINSAQYARLYNQARTNDGLEPIYSDEDIAGYENPSIFYPNVDYYDEFLKSNTTFQRFNAQLIGGSDKTQYFLNVGYVGENGLENVGKQQNFNRLNVRSNLDYQVTDVVSMFLDISGRLDMWERADITNNDLFTTLSSHRPNDYPLYVSQNMDTDSLGWSPRVDENLVGELARSGYINTKNYYAQTNIGMNFDLNKYVEGLSAGAYLTFDVYNEIKLGKSLEYSRIDPSDMTRIGTDVLESSEGRKGDDMRQNVGIVGNIDYVKAWDEHALQLNFASVTQTLSRKSTLSGRSTQQDEKSVNLGLRANYAYKGKYTVEGTSSYMGSDKFTKDNRWGLFGGGGLGWIASNEDFLKHSKTINYLKLKGTYGVMGYDRQGDNAFDYLLYNDFYVASGSFRTGAKNSNIEYGWKANQIGNPELTFEKSRELNIGAEASLFNNKVDLEVNYFNEYRYDIPVILDNALPDYTGQLKPFANYNEVKNSGVDFYVRYSDNVNDFNYSVGLNMMYSKATHEVFDEVNEYAHLNKTGNVTDAIWGWKADGLYMNEEDIANYGVSSSYGDIIPGDIKLENFINDKGDNIIDQFDKQIIGNSSPRVNYSVNVNLEWKGLALYVLGQGATGMDKILNNSYYWNVGENKYSVQALDAAIPGAVQGATYPRLTSLSSSHSYRTSTYWMVNGAWFKLRNIELSYTLPEFISSKIASDKVKLFVRGNDLFTISDINDSDPESMDAGVTKYPTFKTVSFGLKLTY